MEYADGPPLDEVLSAAQPIAPDKMFSVLGQTAVALHCAHQQVIVHRDIKPANIMIGHLQSCSQLAAYLALTLPFHRPADGTKPRSGNPRPITPLKWLASADFPNSPLRAFPRPRVNAHP
jgi:serine/threonine protein kinase